MNPEEALRPAQARSSLPPKPANTAPHSRRVPPRSTVANGVSGEATVDDKTKAPYLLRALRFAMQHSAKGKSKIVRRCTLPLTSSRTVDLVVTELAVIAFPQSRATLMETAPGVSVQEVIAATEAELVIPVDVPEMAL